MRITRRLPQAAIGLILIPSLFLIGCLSTPPLDDTSDAAFPAYGLISPQQAVAVLNTMLGRPDFVLLDIRTAPEVAESHIPGAVALDFYSPTFQDNLAEIEREITYLVYCRTGNRSGQTMALMEDLGFEKVFDLDGGIRAWTNSDYAVCAGSLDAEHSCSGGLF